jgi:type IV pilus assembly protein PilA
MKTQARVTNSQAGFSLIELMIVVAIIGILATIAVPNFQKFQAKARQSEAKGTLSAIYTSEKAFYGEWGQFYEDYRALGYCPEGKLRYRSGFKAAGSVNSPNNWPSGQMGVSSNAAATEYNTSQSINNCNFTENLQQTIPSPTLSSSAQVGSYSNFTAEARGDITGNSVEDVWQVDNTKTFSVIQSGI